MVQKEIEKKQRDGPRESENDRDRKHEKAGYGRTLPCVAKTLASSSASVVSAKFAPVSLKNRCPEEIRQGQQATSIFAAHSQTVLLLENMMITDVVLFEMARCADYREILLEENGIRKVCAYKRKHVYTLLLYNMCSYNVDINRVQLQLMQHS